jgi:hypothetical protein
MLDYGPKRRNSATVTNSIFPLRASNPRFQALERSLLGLEDQPVLVLHSYQAIVSLQDATMEDQSDRFLVPLLKVKGSLVPDLDFPSPVLSFRYSSFEANVVKRMIIHSNRQPFYSRRFGWPSRHSPALEHSVQL